ncbi:slightly ste11-like protein [Ciborinia camelliae]|nr:slightly ste11-like protein [Ciborinia camelliae]
MSIIAEVRRTNGTVGREVPRSPVSISTDSSRRNSLRPILPDKHSEPPTPVSPPTFDRLSRKRAASLDTESANQPRIGDLALNSASTSNSTGGPSPISDTAVTEQVCLCQPDPKIPRPRNAFILYRQHYQAQVVAQHPGLANPEISKIIGEQWRDQAPSVKEEWKRLAEEEKQRHQRQYPNYRYQPRRAGKTVGNRPLTSTSDDPIRCPRCNGRYISTPSTPLTPFTPAFGAAVPRSDRLLPAFSSNNQSQQPQQSQFQSQIGELERPRYLAQMPGSGRVDSPRIGPPPQQMVRRHQYPQPLHTHHEHDQDVEMQSPSPDFKRRRFTNDPRVYPQASPMTYSNPQQGFSRNQQIPMSAGPFRNPPQPLPASRPGAMGPPQSAPLRSTHLQQSMTPTYRNRTPTFDESLRLPPLQTQLPTPSSAHRPADRDTRHESRESQARSIEAMVMTIPYMNKLTVLSKISPPLAAPGPTSPAHEIRGAVIAVEGVEKGLIREVGDFIKSHLDKDASCVVRTWVTESSPGQESREPGALVGDEDTEMRDVSAVKETGKERNNQKEKEKVKEKDENKHETAPDMKDVKEKELADPFVEYLSTISQWHRNSSQITKFITTIPPSSPRREASTTSSTPHSSEASQSSTPHKRTPIALIPHGYSLTMSDTYSMKLPINDSYAPVDHWQWMATLWRGIVGADLTVFVKGVGREEMERCGGVEWSVGAGGRGIVVRILVSERAGREGSLGSAGDASAGLRKGSVSTVGSGGGERAEREREKESGGARERIKAKMDEKTRRRLGFEVGEWVRGIDAGWGRI